MCDAAAAGVKIAAAAGQRQHLGEFVFPDDPGKIDSYCSDFRTSATTLAHHSITRGVNCFLQETVEMTEPAKKRRVVRPPQSQQPQTIHTTPRSLTSATRFTASVNQDGTSPSENRYSTSSHTLPHETVPLAFPLDNSLLHYPYSHPGFLIPETAAADPLSTQVGGVPPLPFVGGIQAQLYAGVDTRQSVNPPSTAETGQYQNQRGVLETFLPVSTLNYDTDEFSALDPEDLWRDVSLYRLDGGVSLTTPAVVGAADVWSRKRGSFSPCWSPTP